MSYAFDGKVALVTGSSVGIGLATAVAFARAGAKVVLNARRTEAGEQAAADIRATGGEATFIQADMADPQQVAHLFDQTIRIYGRLDCAVNNAGQFHGLYPLTDCPQTAWDQTLLVNLTSVWWCMQHEVRYMLEQASGAIVNVSSIAGLIGFPEHASYIVSKHGMNGLTKSAALEYAARGIRINAVCPGLIETPMADVLIGSKPGMSDVLKQMHPIGRFGSSEETAALIVFLCSEQASFITGSIIPVDGGWTAQ